ncbi:unnamed protein product [Darwinula stevensoni]|uniref:C-type lectin domain-containing protein n=1 Tax=Darwinula stevensoni TaxID=69355 RepID=A0A7R9A7B0_9CRUS|nr:unnamed protein product [Darwinula stevensoni]CAG0892476.1 unnamed protein product [Darwinula stevensoni]
MIMHVIPISDWPGRSINCKVFALTTSSGATVCLLGANTSTVQTSPVGISSALYYDDAFVPAGYTIAMLTDEIHFLKFPGVATNYNAALDYCKTDGARLVVDDKGLAWHDRIMQIVLPLVTTTFWLGGEDLDGDHVYKWIDGLDGTTSWNLSDGHNLNHVRIQPETRSPSELRRPVPRIASGRSAERPHGPSSWRTSNPSSFFRGRLAVRSHDCRSRPTTDRVVLIEPIRIRPELEAASY